jgi:hypothetical protein
MISDTNKIIITMSLQLDVSQQKTETSYDDEIVTTPIVCAKNIKRKTRKKNGFRKFPLHDPIIVDDYISLGHPVDISIFPTIFNDELGVSCDNNVVTPVVCSKNIKKSMKNTVDSNSESNSN